MFHLSDAELLVVVLFMIASLLEAVAGILGKKDAFLAAILSQLTAIFFLLLGFFI